MSKSKKNISNVEAIILYNPSLNFESPRRKKNQESTPNFPHTAMKTDMQFEGVSL